MRILFITIISTILVGSCSQKTTPTTSQSSEQDIKTDSIDTLVNIPKGADTIIPEKPYIFHPLDDLFGITDKTNSLNHQDTLVYLLKEPCYGRCPHYEVLIFSNGFSYMKGHKFTSKIGNYITRLDSSKLSEVEQLIASNKGWSTYLAKYPSHKNEIFDLPKTTIQVKDRTIVYRQEEPISLTKTIEEIESLIWSYSW